MLTPRGGIALLALAFCIDPGRTQPIEKTPANAETRKAPTLMIENIPYLPFGIGKETPLDKVKILLAFYNAKTGAGRQEITLRAVNLFANRNAGNLGF